ncbi:MAG: 7-cyano-7-deazaguanine synthase, partial [Phycisphaeraceae bacterium]|nr:7-cyano-7-deazaguanine synthase [Phycisphaeraceae bacterium]
AMCCADGLTPRQVYEQRLPELRRKLQRRDGTILCEAADDPDDLATRAAIEGRRLTIHTPLIDWPKVKIIEHGLELGVDYAITHSCYDPHPDAAHALGCRPCGRCDACLLRKRAFEHLNQTDPVLE